MSGSASFQKSKESLPKSHEAREIPLTRDLISSCWKSGRRSRSGFSPTSGAIPKATPSVTGKYYLAAQFESNEFQGSWSSSE
jgi:hypothetical protein